MTDNDLIQFLKTQKDIPAEKYDGSYELVEKTVEFLSKQEIGKLGVTDLEMLYFMTVHTGKSSFEHKKQKVRESHLADEDKIGLFRIIDTIQNKVGAKEYVNSENGQMGMFGAAFFKFSKTSDSDARQLIEMCIKILQEKDENKMFDIAGKFLKDKLKGIGIATVSQILHCLKPTVFPVINNAVSEMGKLHLKLEDPKDITQYVTNTKAIKKFRDENLPFKNYIILDHALFEMNANKEAENTPQGIVSDKVIGEPTMPLNQILYGPPGTGKTHELITKYFPLFTTANGVENYAFITFHQAYSYEEFIEGIRPEIDDKGQVRYEIKPGIFKIMVEKAKADPHNKYAIFIDEINRGNIAKIFGELITLLEEDKRMGGKNKLLVQLPYSPKEKFGIPSNLYVIGTMNTADRSIALIDIALRRRFNFVEIPIRYDLKNLRCKDILKKLNEKIREKNEPEYQIGHSYFLHDSNSSDFNLEKVMNDKIIPLLKEYFYNDLQTIEEILNYAGILIKEEEKKLGRILYQSYTAPHEEPSNPV